jgi:lipopolysaccharide export system permease protein
LEGYTVKVDRKSDNEVWDILVYDHSDRSQGNNRLVTAPHGVLKPFAGGKWLELTLENGSIYEELQARNPEERAGRPFLRATFDTAFLRFNMAQFQGKDLYAVQRSNQFNMLTVSQLESSLDSLNRMIGTRRHEMGREWTLRYSGLDSARAWGTEQNPVAPFEQLDPVDQARIVGNARFMAEAQQERLAQSKMELDYRSEVAIRHQLEWHKKFAIGLTCVLLFFIGAPLGAVIRKGGFGLPFVLSVVLFLLHYVLGMVSEKMGRGAVIGATEAIWLPNLVLLPLAIWITWLAAQDKTWNFRKNERTAPVQ